MNNEKKKSILATVALIAIFSCVGTAIAYLVSSSGQSNQMKIGKGDAKIEETFDPPPKLETGANIYQKLVTVKNGGKNPCFVRVFMDFTDIAVKESTGIKTYFFKPTATDANGNLIIPETAPDKDNPSWVEASKWTPDDGWEYISEGEGGLAGFYYYQKPVEIGESTPPLISWVRTDYTTENDITDYQILVYSETVQIVEIDNSGTKYTSENYRTAWENYLRVPPFVLLKANIPDNLTVYNNENYTADTDSIKPDSFKQMFMGNKTLTSVNLDIDLQSKDSENNVHTVSSMQEMFKDCTELKNVSLKADNFDKVTNFTDMFSGCNALETITLESKHGTANIDISALFKHLTGLKTITLTGFNITGIDSAFSTCGNLEKVSFIGGTITGNASTMFSGCSNLSSVNLEGLASTDNPTGMLSASKDKLTDVIISGDLSQLSSFRGIWGGGSECRTILNTLKLNNTGNAPTITAGGEAFGSYSTNNQWSALEEIELKNMVAAGSSAQCLYKLCQGDTNLQTAVITGDLSNISSLQYAYYGCSSLVSCDISTTTNLGNLTTAQEMFNGCSKLFCIDNNNGTYTYDADAMVKFMSSFVKAAPQLTYNIISTSQNNERRLTTNSTSTVAITGDSCESGVTKISSGTLSGYWLKNNQYSFDVTINGTTTTYYIGGDDTVKAQGPSTTQN